MKTTFKYIALTALAIICGLNASAQNLPEGTYEGKNGIAYRKSSTLKPGTTDTYVVNLETFVYGEVTVKNVSVPADIVLVLDVSGSMDEPLSYSALPRQSYSYDSYGDNRYYYLYQDEYYEVERVENTDYYYYNRYALHLKGTNGYIYGNNRVTTSFETACQYYTNRTLFTGVLYEAGETRIDALKTAVNAFITQIQLNDLYDDDGNRRKDENNQDTSLGNQISIVKFAGDALNNTSEPTDGSTTYDYNFTQGNVTFSGTSQYTEVLARFLSASDDYDTLTGIVDDLYALGGTAADYGTEKANLLFSWLEANYPDRNSTRTVVFFTDGSPTHARDFDSTVASTTVGNAYTLKSTHKASVFTIGVFDSISSELENYMNYVSSNYPDARNMSQPGNPVPEAQMNYYQNASQADLTSIFTTIGQASGGSGATEVTSESTVTVDVVATSFSLPSGVTADDITVTVAPCIEETKPKEDAGEGKEHLFFKFGEDKPSTEYNLPAITPSVVTAENKVSTTGFDYTGNWCGFDESLGTDGEWRGYKQTISFEVKLNDSAVGGPNVATNDRKSGIYVNGNPVAEFNRPVVKIPVSLWIMKKGLQGDDSAVFNVQYAKYEEGVDPTSLPSSAWKSFTKVIVNSNDPKEKNPHDKTDDEYYPIVKLVGLDPDYFYRIKEDAWAWTYTYVDYGIQYVFGEDQQNPFVFTNNPQPNIKSAESSVRNKFNPGTTTSTPSE